MILCVKRFSTVTRGTLHRLLAESVKIIAYDLRKLTTQRPIVQVSFLFFRTVCLLSSSPFVISTFILQIRSVFPKHFSLVFVHIVRCCSCK